MYTAFEAGLESRHALAEAALCYGGRPESGFLLGLGNTRFQIRLLLSVGQLDPSLQSLCAFRCGNPEASLIRFTEKGSEGFYFFFSSSSR